MIIVDRSGIAPLNVPYLHGSFAKCLIPKGVSRLTFSRLSSFDLPVGLQDRVRHIASLSLVWTGNARSDEVLPSSLGVRPGQRCHEV